MSEYVCHYNVFYLNFNNGFYPSDCSKLCPLSSDGWRPCFLILSVFLSHSLTFTLGVFAATLVWKLSLRLCVVSNSINSISLHIVSFTLHATCMCSKERRCTQSKARAEGRKGGSLLPSSKYQFSRFSTFIFVDVFICYI